MTRSEDEARLAAILDGIEECFYAVGRDWRITFFNREAELFFGWPRETMLGRPLTDAIDIEAVPALKKAYEAAMAGTASGRVEIESVARPGRFLEGRAFPLPDGFGVGFRDVTERRASEEALRRREAELARVQRIAGVGGLEVELRHGFRNTRSPEYLLLHGLPESARNESHEEWVARIHPEDRERAEGNFRAVVAGLASTYSAEYRIVRPSDGQLRWIAATAEIERDPDGRPIRLVGAHRDITERKRAEEQQRLLINELNHRVKNTLATVQSIAAQSLRRSSNPQEAWSSFEERLMALSRVHDVLTSESWEGADLALIVEKAVEPYAGGPGEDRIVTSGPSVRLPPQLALGFAMTLQELATNAVKYGALSAPSGTVDIRWKMRTSDDLRLVWAESGGPTVVEPGRRGFGTRLIERGLASDGNVELRFEPTGLVFTAEARLTHEVAERSGA